MSSRLVTVEQRDPEAEVLVVTNMWPTDDRPGFGIFVKRQVESLREAGLRCDVLFLRGYRSPLAYAWGGLRLAALNLRRRAPYRLVHAHGGETGVAARAYLRGPLIVSYGGSDVLGPTDGAGRVSLGWRLRSRIVRWSSLLAGATITKAVELHDALPARSRRHNEVIPNGVDRRVFKPQPRERARARLGWGPEERVALFAANPELPYKRYWLAAAACEEAERATGPIRLETANGVPPSLVPTMMSAADCLLHPSQREGSPNVVKEALACDLPVVATDAGDIRTLLDGVSDSYVCEATTADIARALVAVLDPPRRSNGRRASAWLGQDQIAGRVFEHYARAGYDVRPAQSADAMIARSRAPLGAASRPTDERTHGMGDEQLELRHAR